MASHPQGLPRERRLLLPREFAKVRATGHRLVVGCLILNWRNAPESRLGVVTSKKVGGAVIRNRARRVLRECFRRYRMNFETTVEMVLVARRSISTLTMAEVENDFLVAARRAGIIQGEE